MSPAGSEHGNIVNNVAFAVTLVVKPQQLGNVFGAEPASSSTETRHSQAPDVALSAKNEYRVERRVIFDGPRISGQVLSPSDTHLEVNEKAEDWLTPPDIRKSGWLIPDYAEFQKLTFVE